MRWEVKALGDVCEIIGGGTPSKKVEAYYGGEIPWATVGDLNVEQLIATDLRITPAGLENSSAKVIPSGNVVIATRVGLGKSCILNEDTAINQDLKGLVPKDSIGLLPRFLFRWTQSIAPRIIAAGTGATVQGVKIKFVSQLPMPVPSIEEQARIVEVLDEAFASIDKAKANIERNLTNARELFQSRLKDIFSNPSEDWVEQSLDELGRVQSGGTPSRGKSAYWNDGVIEWYSSRELNQEWTLPSKEKITIEGLENSNAKLFSAGSLLIGIYDTAAMKMSILTEESAFNQAIVGVEFDKNIDVRFMRFQLMAMSDEIRSQRRGTRQQNLSLKKIKDVSVFVPELTVQNKVVQSIGLLRNAVHAIESKYQSEIENLEELRQSILEQAFEGKLTEPVAA